jgi:hypothetical protein
MYKTVVYQGLAWKIVDNYARAALKFTVLHRSFICTDLNGQINTAGRVFLARNTTTYLRCCMPGSAPGLIMTSQEHGTKMVLYLRFRMDNTTLHVFL